MLGHKKEWNHAVCNNRMGLEDIILCEMLDKKTNTVCYHLYVESKRSKTSEYSKREIDPYMENKLAVTSGEREEQKGKIDGGLRETNQYV